MPDGYLVQLGNASLDAGDQIVDPLTTFTTDTNLGAGVWVWSGTFGGTTYSNTSEPGVYHLATDGNVYFVPDYGPVTTITTATVNSAPSYSAVSVVEGTGGDDVIDNLYTDEDGDQVDSLTGNADDIRAGDGNDSIEAGLGDDTVLGGGGDDTIDGGAGNDIIHGDSSATVTATAEFLDWESQGPDGSNLSAGFTQNTGEMDVSVAFASTGNNNPTFQVEAGDAQYVGTGEPMDTSSSLYLFGQGDAATSSTTISFAAAAGSEMQNQVENVTFRINDIDWGSGNHQDVVTVNAIDADGNAVSVTITPDAGDSVSGNTITAGLTGETAADAAGSALVEIAGPVAQIEILYSNILSGTQGIWVTDVHFDTLPPVAGDDVIDGGAGDDQIFGEDGNDSLTGGAGADTLTGGAGDDWFALGAGDSAIGGDGDDTFTLDPTNLGGGTITIQGDETGETTGDTLDFGGLLDWDDVTYTNTNDAAGGNSGTATLTDGTIVNFSNIENIIICFAAGTAILTPTGERPVQDLQPGDLVVTRDNGAQPLRWIGKRTVAGTGNFAPIRIAKGQLGAQRDLLVSPQHRMLHCSVAAGLYFDSPEVLMPAKHLINGTTIRPDPCAQITYIHLLFDHHQIVYADGAPAESFHPAQMGIEAISAQSREELFAVFPELRSDPNQYGDTVRPCLRKYESRLLQAA